MEQNLIKAENLTETQCPWIIFKLMDNLFAVNSLNITGIMMLPEQIEKMPEAPAHIRGICSAYGQIIPLLDMHTMFHWSTLNEQLQDFTAMIQARRQDHITWVDTLRKSLQENTEFNLSTDPHKCAFGKWYDHYENKNTWITFKLKQVDEPHQKLHFAAANIQKLRKSDDKNNEAQIQKEMRYIEQVYAPRVIKGLEDVINAFTDHTRELLLIFNTGTKNIGLIVDDIKAVDQLSEITSGKESDSLLQNHQYISAISQYEDEIVLILDMTSILELMGNRQEKAETGPSMVTAASVSK